MEMRFFGGMPLEQVCAVLGLSERTVRRHWVFAKAWLCRALWPERPGPVGAAAEGGP